MVTTILKVLFWWFMFSIPASILIGKMIKVGSNENS